MGWFAKLVGKSPEFREPIQDPALGSAEWDSTARMWVFPPHADRTFAIALAGQSTPDARLLPFARQLHASAQAFQRKVTAAIEAQASTTPGIAETIRSLEIDVVDLNWPDRPRDGMVYFRGGEHDPLWRFDLINGQPVHLGCDT